MSVVLSDIKLLLGFTEDYTAFDDVLVMHINTALLSVKMLGVNDDETLIIGKETTWVDLLGPTSEIKESTKNYIYYKVRLVFDPPTTAAGINAMQEEARELSWKIASYSEE